ncbi:MAG: T9SS type A sorting domain-containing protein, partial [Cytophagales bacterium]|nr:T9SS type A sorting domain-containing protein [Cytophagales bacterium]
TLNSVSGTFTDGSGSSDYLNNTNCNWLISPSVTPTFITLSFSAFNTESNVDIVRVYNGPSNAYPLVASFSGTNIPSTITVAGTSLFVNFSSNSSITGQGWTANYTSSTSTYCAGFTLVTSTSGIITDGSGATNYLNNTNCRWLINPTSVTSISISFSQFATESNWDYVYVYNGTTTGSQLLGSYSGSTLPPTLTSTGPMLLVFSSDGSNVNAGWTASYTATLATTTTTNNSIQVNSNTLNFGNIGGIQTLTVTNMGSWTVTSTANWMVVSPTTGTGNGIVTISVPSNLSTSSLTGSLVFSNGSSQFIVQVNQAASIITDINSFGSFEDIQLHPNPTEGAVNLWITSKVEGQLSVVVKDLLGRTIFTNNQWISQKENTIPLDLSGYNAGTYIIEINLNGAGTNRRVIKL